MINEINGYKTKPEWFIDKGSFGSVYKAEKDGKYYAIKVFQSDLLKSKYKERIDREIKAIQKIEHANVVKVYDFGTFEENNFEYFYIVMDYIDGNPLSDYVGTYEEEKVISLVSSVLDTLSSIHSSGIIHRDLKPANIKINSAGTPIILDFGLSKLIDYSAITQTGERIGTFYYMSPEQVTDSKNIDFRSDYFAIGVILYELMTGFRPYQAKNLPALINEIQNEYPQNPSELNSSISNKLENIILKLLEKEQYKRYQTIDSILMDLKQDKPEQVKKPFDIGTFYLRLLHNEKAIFKSASELGLVKNVIFPSNFFERYHPTVDLIKESGINFSTDPATNRLVYTAFSKTAGVQELPYSSGDEVQPTQIKDFNSISKIQNFVKTVISFQVENGVTQLVAPYFFSKNSSDDWFNINIKLIKESIEYKDSYHPDLEIWGGICMNVENWHDEEEKSKVLNAYVKANPDGFFVYGDPIDKKSNLTQLFHFSDFLKKLQTYSASPVVACRINGLSLILLSIGIYGTSSGASSLDSFRESILSDVGGDYAVDPRYYVPELFSLVSLKKGITAKLINIKSSSLSDELSCKCSYCASIDSGSLSYKDIKMHFLYRRNEEISKLLSIPEPERLDYIEKKLILAIEYVKILKGEKIKLANFSHLNTWLDLISQFKKKDF